MFCILANLGILVGWVAPDLCMGETSDESHLLAAAGPPERLVLANWLVSTPSLSTL